MINDLLPEGNKINVSALLDIVVNDVKNVLDMLAGCETIAQEITSYIVV